MNRIRIACAALALSCVGAAFAQTAPAGLTREQVRAELAEAQRRGEIPLPGEVGRTPREVTPGRYPAASAPAGLTRAEVVAQLKEARRDGDVEVGETGRTAYEIEPRNYPQHMAEPGRTREEVRAEYAEARRTGDLVADGEIGDKLNERFPRRYANVKPQAMAAASQPVASR